MDSMYEKELKQYFLRKELDEMTPYQRLRFTNQLENYRQQEKLGLNIPKPNFMKRVITNQDSILNTHGEDRNAQESETIERLAKRRQKGASSDEDEWLPDKNVGSLSSQKSSLRKKSTQVAEGIMPCKNEPAKIVKTVSGPSHASGGRYPKRVRPFPNYKEIYVPDQDDFIYCDKCEREWEGDCKQHPLEVISDTPVPVDKSDEKRAINTTPSMLKVDTSKIPDAGLGVWARQCIRYRTRFGPYEGKIVPENDTSGYGWQIRENGKAHHCVDASEPGLSNWMRYVNCARHIGEQNLMAYQYRGQLYYRTIRDIAPLEELLVHYGDSYARDLGIEPEGFRSETQEPLKSAVFECKSCPLKFTSPVYLERHKCNRRLSGPLKDISNQEGIPEKEKPFGCQHCPARFDRKNSLVRHIRIHTGEKPFACTHCSKRFFNSSCLKKHERRHTNEKPFACDLCSARFAHSGDLTKHRRIHTNEKPFECEFCSARFAFSGNLTDHRRIHTNEKPFECEFCSARFVQNGTLTYHRRIHTGEKPYKCSHCDKAFINSSNLKRHIRVNHNK